MKSNHAALALLAVTVLASAAQAAELTPIVKCAGAHHGSYVQIDQLGRKGMVFVTITTDAGDAFPAQVFTIDSVKRDGQNASPQEFSAWIRESVERDGSQPWEGTAIAQASGDAGSILLNFGNFFGKSYLVSSEGHVEELACESLVK